jgi:hypothetical protein
MSTKQNTALTGLITALVFVSGCGPSKLQNEPGPGHNHGQENNRSFRIYIYHDQTQPGHQCLVDWPQAILWKNKHHTATWVSDDDAEYKVDFNLGSRGSPFSGGSGGIFDVPSHGEGHSGDLLATSHDYYDYGIRDANGICKKASGPDPGVYVK